MAENTPTTNPPAAPAAAAPARESGPSQAPRGRPERSDQPRRGRYSGPRPPKTCPFCSAKVKQIDYKSGDALRRYLTERGKIKARRKIGTCAKHQRRLSLAIKRARHIALLPFTASQARGE
jgi:small subunit ribosomal protein S18